MSGIVNTVLGPVPADYLGVTSVHESLLSVIPGAQFGYDITIDRAEIFEILLAKLADFRAHGGGTIVDSTGMFHGRDVTLLEALSRASGVAIVASTGLGPEDSLGGYFLTPQTNPPTPWPAEKFATLFSAEVTEGAVVPRVERRAPVGLIAVTTSASGTTATDESLVRGAARAALATGVAVSLRFGVDAAADLETLLAEGIAPDRILVGGLDTVEALGAGTAIEIAALGAYVGIDHIGSYLVDGGYDGVTDDTRARLVAELVATGRGDRVILSSNAIGVAKGLAAREVPFSHILSDFVPALRARGLDEATIQRILVDNPRELLTVR